MKISRVALHTAQIVTGLTAAAVAYAVLPRRFGRLERKVVLVTGGSRGLGFALAERYGRDGARLVITARNENELERARLSLIARGAVASGDDILAFPADLTDPAQAADLIEHAIQHFGHIDVLINNAGVIEVGPVEDQSLAAYHRSMDVNFFGALHTIQAALPHLLRRKTGAIVNIASVGGKLAVPHMLPYVASKFALVGFSQGLHAELRHKGIRVTTVCPGLMRTGGEAHATFSGRQKKEERWFKLAATTPYLSASIAYATERIFNAVAAGRAEIIITPQAWVAARFAGVAPEVTQRLASLATRIILPRASSDAVYGVKAPASSAPGPMPSGAAAWEAAT